jgi:hypothetical protein
MATTTSGLEAEKQKLGCSWNFPAQKAFSRASDAAALDRAVGLPAIAS